MQTNSNSIRTIKGNVAGRNSLFFRFFFLAFAVYGFASISCNSESSRSKASGDDAAANSGKAQSFQSKPFEALGVESGGMKLSAYGTGFFISSDGYMLTNNHVIAGARRISVSVSKKEHPASVVSRDGQNDLALLKVEGSSFCWLDVDSRSSVRLGDAIATIGYPNPDIQGVAPKVTKGELSSLNGLQDDPRLFQISASIQPGNSGGPLLNPEGRVIGVVCASLSSLGMLVSQGVIPQNVNYAVKTIYVLPLLESLKPEREKSLCATGQSMDVCASATGLISVWKAHIQATGKGERNIKMISGSMNNGIPHIVLRNNNPFYVNNISLELHFFDAKTSKQMPSPIIYWLIDDLIAPGVEYQFDLFSEVYQPFLMKRPNAFPTFKVLSLERVKLED